MSFALSRPPTTAEDYLRYMLALAMVARNQGVWHVVLLLALVLFDGGQLLRPPALSSLLWMSRKHTSASFLGLYSCLRQRQTSPKPTKHTFLCIHTGCSGPWGGLWKELSFLKVYQYSLPSCLFGPDHFCVRLFLHSFQLSFLPFDILLLSHCA